LTDSYSARGLQAKKIKMPPRLHRDKFILDQTKVRPISDLQDCAIGIDATYYCNIFLSKYPYHEPLLVALGGLTGIKDHIEKVLDQFKEHNITPFFVFDGQPQTCEEELALRIGTEMNALTNEAWDLYFDGKATDAVLKFSAITTMCRPQVLYPLLKRILRRRNLHFLVAPFNASAQLAHLDMVDSDQCAAIMGSHELLLYPISDNIITSLDWEKGNVEFISKKSIFDAIRAASNGLHVNEPLFIDGLLLLGTNSLRTFPPLLHKDWYKPNSTLWDMLAMLRANEKSVAKALASFNDMVTPPDADWLDWYQKARMATQHFVYIAENGEVKVNDPENLTGDNHKYLGLQLPAEVFHYLNTGLISERIPSYITHLQVVQQPTLDGVNSPEYRDLVTKHVVPTLETALSLVMTRLHRGIIHMEINFKTWYDSSLQLPLNCRGVQQAALEKANSWNGAGHTTDHDLWPICYESASLVSDGFAAETRAARGKPIRGIDDAAKIKSVVVWRWMHLRGYISDEHTLTRWGMALTLALIEFKGSPELEAKLTEPLLMAFELMRLGLFNNPHLHEDLYGLPLNGSAEDKAHVLLLSRVATLLRLRQLSYGYTGPLNKNLLAFRSLSTTVREANRDLVEAILLSMFLHGQCERERDDQVDISQSLPFVETPDISMGIAVKTFLDDVPVNADVAQRNQHLTEFQPRYFPYATHLAEDLDQCWKLFDALTVGVRNLDDESMSSDDRTAWHAASTYLASRR
jgi:hypothetical protein